MGKNLSGRLGSFSGPPPPVPKRFNNVIWANRWKLQFKSCDLLKNLTIQLIDLLEQLSFIPSNQQSTDNSSQGDWASVASFYAWNERLTRCLVPFLVRGPSV